MKSDDFRLPRQADDEEEEVEEEDEVDRSSNKLGVVGVELVVRDGLETSEKECWDKGEIYRRDDEGRRERGRREGDELKVDSFHPSSSC